MFRWPSTGASLETSTIEMLEPTLKVKPGLSDVANSAGDRYVAAVRDYIEPLIQNASAIVPESLWTSTRVYIMATAGQNHSVRCGDPKLVQDTKNKRISCFSPLVDKNTQ